MSKSRLIRIETLNLTPELQAKLIENKLGCVEAIWFVCEGSPKHIPAFKEWLYTLDENRIKWIRSQLPHDFKKQWKKILSRKKVDKKIIEHDKYMRTYTKWIEVCLKP